jgi:hypothetical protein
LLAFLLAVFDLWIEEYSIHAGYSAFLDSTYRTGLTRFQEVPKPACFTTLRVFCCSRALARSGAVYDGSPQSPRILIGQLSLARLMTRNGDGFSMPDWRLVLTAFPS